MTNHKTPDTSRVVAPPPLLYAIPLALGLLVQHFYPRAILPPGWSWPIAILLTVAGLSAFPAVLAFRRAGTSPNPWQPATALVVTGLYRWTRNPMYLGFTLIYLGVTIWVNTAWPLVPLPVVLLIMQRGVIAREEAYLEARFGDAYRGYKARVRRWL